MVMKTGMLQEGGRAARDGVGGVCVGLPGVVQSINFLLLTSNLKS
jgi:hypothetical protein